MADHFGSKFVSTASTGDAPASGVTSSFLKTDLHPHIETGIVSTFTAVGIVQGTLGALRAHKEHDTAGTVVNGANAASATASLVLTVAENMGSNVAPAAEILGKANIPLTVATGIYQVAHEKGNFIDTERDGSHDLGNKGERALAVGGTIALGAGMTAAGVSTAGIVPVVAVTSYAVEKGIETRRAFKSLDRDIADSAQPKRFDFKAPGQDGKPSVLHYAHIPTELLLVAQQMDDKNLSKPLNRGKDGRITAEEMRKIDMRDPKNIKEFERVLDQQIQKETKIKTDNDSVMPEFLRWGKAAGESVEKMEMAKIDLAGLQGAKAELQMYKKELSDYDKAHPGDPATTAPAAAKPVVTAAAKPARPKDPGGP